MADFDAGDLRNRLPPAVRSIARFINGTVLPAVPVQRSPLVLVHCNAGLGRSPAVALAYQFWVEGSSLDAALADLMAVRPCHPQLHAIREATCDLLQQAVWQGTLATSELAFQERKSVILQPGAMLTPQESQAIHSVLFHAPAGIPGI